MVLFCLLEAWFQLLVCFMGQAKSLYIIILISTKSLKILWWKVAYHLGKKRSPFTSNSQDKWEVVTPRPSRVNKKPLTENALMLIKMASKCDILQDIFFSILGEDFTDVRCSFPELRCLKWVLLCLSCEDNSMETITYRERGSILCSKKRQFSCLNLRSLIPGRLRSKKKVMILWR